MEISRKPYLLYLQSIHFRLFWFLWTAVLFAYLLMRLPTLAWFIALCIPVTGLKLARIAAERRHLVDLHTPGPHIATFLNNEIDLDEYRRRKKSDRLQPCSEAEALWDAVCAVLCWHNRGNDGCIQTLNRLWRKHPQTQKASSLPVLQLENLSFDLESWSVERLVGLLPPTYVTNKTPRSLAPPVIILRYDQIDYLIDGRTRINYWKRTADTGQHRIIIIKAY